jgi:hypothetical protein
MDLDLDSWFAKNSVWITYLISYLSSEILLLGVSLLLLVGVPLVLLTGVFLRLNGLFLDFLLPS